jgi:hypothetical protein
MNAEDTITRRACDDCGRTWEGAVPSPEVVHIWYCPWCETRMFGRDVTWQQQPDDTWVNTHHLTLTEGEYPWRGPLRRVK